MSDLERVLSSAAQDVFEGLCFATVVDSTQQAPASWQMTSRVSFSGAMRGRLELRLFEVNTSRLVEEMLGEVEEGTQSLEGDAVRELTNVLCGHILPRAYGAELVFDIGVPEFSSVPTVAAETDGAVARSLLSIEEGTIQLCLFIEEESARDSL